MSAPGGSGVRRAGRARPSGWLALGLPLAVLLSALGFAAQAWARVGGGDSFSGGGGGGGGFGGGGGDSDGLFLLIWLVFEHPVIGIPLLAIVAAVWLISKARGRGEEWSTWNGAESDPGMDPQVPQAPSRRWAVTSGLDPDFSPVVFEDFLYALFARVHEARGAGRLEELAPYLSPAARGRLAPEPGLMEVKGIIVGAMRLLLERPPGPGRDRLQVRVRFEANFTEVIEGKGRGSERTVYVVEHWALSRQTGVRSKPPEKARVLGCPNCGAALTAVRGETCGYCAAVVRVGEFDWGVDSIEVLTWELRPPTFAAGTEERGTEMATRVDPVAEQLLAELTRRDPEVDLPALRQRAAMVFLELQQAWTGQDWTRARPYVTDNLFQMQLYWMEAYRRRRVRNVIESATVDAVELARVASDRWYDSVTLRIHARCADYYVSEDGQFLGGRRRPQPFSEYWTFVRGRGRTGAPGTEKKCPNCGAPLNINQAGICGYCQAKVTSGDFDWVVSRIEQDESYAG